MSQSISEETQISIIVPVYNAGRYLARCVRSIMGQTCRAVEVILVDDGSTDASAALCDALAAEDGRVRVIHQANAGVSAARNAGIEAAQGKYLQFVDADDELLPGYSAALLQKAKASEADLVISGYRNVRNGIQSSQLPPQINISTAKDLAEHFEMFYFSMLLNSPWNKLYRLALVQQGFPLGVPMGEDFMFNMAFLENAKTVAVTHEDGYLYMHRADSDSASMRFSRHRVSSMLEYCDCVMPFLKKWLPEERMQQIYDRVVFHSLCNNLNMLARSRQDSREAVDAYLRNQQIRECIKRIRLNGFPKSKQIVGLCLKARLPSVALAGIRMAAKRT